MMRRPQNDRPEMLLPDTAPTTEAPAAESAVELEELLHQLDDLGVLSFRGPLGDEGVTTASADLVVLGGLTTDMDPVPFLDGLLSLVGAEAPPMAVAADAALDEPPPEGEEPRGIVSDRPGRRADAGRGDDGRPRRRLRGAEPRSSSGSPTSTWAQVGHFGVDDGADSVLPPRGS